MPEPIPLPDPQLLSVAPRAVQYRPKALVFRVVLFGVLLAFSVLVPVFGIIENHRLRDLQANGVPVSGVVTSEYVKGDNPSYYHIYYDYAYAGANYSGGGLVSPTTYAASRVGGPAAIYVLRGDPSFSSIGPVTSTTLNQRLRPWFIIEVLGILTFGYMAFGVDIFFRAQYRFLRDGTIVEAKIIKITSGGSSSGTTVRCTYDSPDGPISRSFNTIRRSVDGLVAGSSVTVIINPAKPKQSMLYKDIRMVTVL